MEKFTFGIYIFIANTTRGEQDNTNRNSPFAIHSSIRPSELSSCLSRFLFQQCMEGNLIFCTLSFFVAHVRRSFIVIRDRIVNKNLNYSLQVANFGRFIIINYQEMIIILLNRKYSHLVTRCTQLHQHGISLISSNYRVASKCTLHQQTMCRRPFWSVRDYII